MHALAQRLASLPLSQLAAMKLVINKAYESQGLAATQTLGSVLDGYKRNTPEARDFIAVAAEQGVRAAIEQRDGPFADYSQASADHKPDPSNVIEP